MWSAIENLYEEICGLLKGCGVILTAKYVQRKKNLEWVTRCRFAERWVKVKILKEFKESNYLTSQSYKANSGVLCLMLGILHEFTVMQFCGMIDLIKCRLPSKGEVLCTCTMSLFHSV